MSVFNSVVFCFIFSIEGVKPIRRTYHHLQVQGAVLVQVVDLVNPLMVEHVRILY